MIVAILGLGKMGSALRGGFERDPRVARVVGTRSGDDNKSAIAESAVVVLAVKPHQARAVVSALAPQLHDRILVSICAGITTGDLASWADGARIARAMPNAPASIGAGITLLAPGPRLTSGDFELLRSLFAGVGETQTLDESLFDAATAVSGCGPAYVFSVIEALADAAAAHGIPPDTALRLATATVLGAARMASECGVEPAVLRADVATPGGATEAGLRVLETGGLQALFARAVAAAARRSGELRE